MLIFASAFDGFLIIMIWMGIVGNMETKNQILIYLNERLNKRNNYMSRHFLSRCKSIKWISASSGLWISSTLMSFPNPIINISLSRQTVLIHKVVLFEFGLRWVLLLRCGTLWCLSLISVRTSVLILDSTACAGIYTYKIWNFWLGHRYKHKR